MVTIPPPPPESARPEALNKWWAVVHKEHPSIPEGEGPFHTWEEMERGTHLHLAKWMMSYGFLPNSRDVDVELPIITSTAAPLSTEDSGKTVRKKLETARHTPAWLTSDTTCSSSANSSTDEVYGPSSPPEPFDL